MTRHFLTPFLILLAGLVGCGGEREADLPLPGVMKLSPQFTGNYSLVKVTGEPAADEDFRGKVGLVYFGFASCPDVCPMALSRMSAALNALDAAELTQIAPIFITVDPARDTPEALRKYLAFDDRIIGLTGDDAAIANARQGFQVYAAKEELPGSAAGYTMNHSSYFYVVDRDGAPTAALQDSMAPEAIAEYLRSAL